MKYLIKTIILLYVFFTSYTIPISHFQTQPNYLTMSNKISNKYSIAYGAFIKKIKPNLQTFRSQQIQIGKKTEFTFYFYTTNKCEIGAINGLTDANKNFNFFKVRAGATFWGYDCSGWFKSSLGKPKKVTGVKVGDTLDVIFDLRQGFDRIEYILNGVNLGVAGQGLSKSNQIYAGLYFPQMNGEVVITSYKVDGQNSNLNLQSSKYNSYNFNKAFKIRKLSTGFQMVKSQIPLPFNKVTTIKIKLLQGFIFIFGVASNTSKIATQYVGRNAGSYGFGCEDGHIYSFSGSPLVDKKCKQDDQILIKYDLRVDVDNISYEKNGVKIGNGTLFNEVTAGNTKQIYFGMSAYTVSEIEITQFEVDGVSMIEKQLKRIQLI